MGTRIAIGPSAGPDWVAEAITQGGGEVVALQEAEGLIWIGSGYSEDLASGPVGLRAALREHPGIRWIQLPFAGVEPYVEAGIFDAEHQWSAGQGVYARPVAEHALGLALAGLRDIGRFARATQWTRPSGISLVEGKVTIFGGGGITRELIGLLEPFDTEITVVRRHAAALPGAVRVLPFEQRYESLRGADVVFLALALTPQTMRFFGAEEFEIMEPHAWLVNVARGGHVVTDELVVALRDGIIGGAALDVTDPEPLPDGHPLWELPNCIISPHTGNTPEMARPLLHERIRENVRRFGAGEPLLGPVDPRLGY